MAQSFDFSIPGYSLLRSLSLASKVYLCREDASDRMLVLKIKSGEKLDLLKKEIYALRDLEGFPYAPRLLFAQVLEQNKELKEMVLGQEYKLGEPLHFLKDKLTETEKCTVKEALKNALHLLHTQYFRTHGDLSPKNILVNRASQGEIKITLIDWEFSEKTSEENLSHHNHYRGTIGYTPLQAGASLKEKDREALSQVFHFLNLKQEKQKRSFLPW